MFTFKFMNKIMFGMAIVRPLLTVYTAAPAREDAFPRNTLNGLACGLLALAGCLTLCAQDLPSPGTPRAATAPELRLLDAFTVLRFGRDEGIPEVAIQAVQQTEDGFIWCLTQNYLLQFDGHIFNRHSNLDSDPIQKPWPILYRGWTVDVQGVPWVYGQRGCGYLTAQGWCRVDVEASYHRFMIGLMPDERGHFWAVASDGVCRIEDGKMISLPNPCPWTPITSVIQDGDGLLLGTKAGLVRLCNHDADVTFLKEHPEIEDVTCLERDKSGHLLVCCKAGLLRQQEGSWERIPLPFSHQIATTLLEDQSGAVWVGTKNGLFRYHAGRWSALGMHDLGMPLEVLCLALDAAGQLWVGTGEGLLYLRPRLVHVLHTYPHKGRQMITSLTHDQKGTLWVGSAEDGLLRVDKDKLTPVSDIGLATGMALSALGKAQDGGLWVGTQGGGLFHLGPGRTRPIPELAGRKENARVVTAILEREAGRLWVGTALGLFTLTNATENTRLVPAVLKHTQNIAATFPHRITALDLDPDGTLWAGAENLQVLRVDQTGQEIVHGYGVGLPGPGVQTLYRDRDGKLWVGTNLGLGLFDGQKKWGRMVASQGLVDGEVRYMAEDNQGRLWLGTRRGLQVFSRAELESVIAGRKSSAEGFVIGQPEGMASEVCTPHASPGVAKDAEGRLYFATTDGLAVVDPSRVHATTNAPPPVLRQVLAGGEKVVYTRSELPPFFSGSDPAVITAATTVTFDAAYRDLTFLFSVPVYDSPQRVRFRWRLEGVDNGWTASATERQARYSSLPSGRYVFRVMAGWQGQWQETRMPFVFYIRPYFYERGAVQALSVFLIALALAVCVWLLQRARYRQRLRRLEGARALEQERARIARDLHDELGVGLTQIGLLGDLLGKRLQQASDGHQLATKLSLRARGLAGSLDEIVWAVNPANDNVQALGDYFSCFAQNLLSDAALAVEMQVEVSPACALRSGVRHQLFLAFKEALNNVLKHARARTVQIAIIERGGRLSLRVADDGCGLQGTFATGSPDGLRGMRERIERLSGNLAITSKDGEGTEVLIEIPVMKGEL